MRLLSLLRPWRAIKYPKGEGEAHAEPGLLKEIRLGGSLALPVGDERDLPRRDLPEK